jgi:HD-GYP domain-containing protein (c-di-GMP phosphodiesterase class II)
MSDTPLRLAELVATLALAQDNAFGQPMESQLRSCALAVGLCDAGNLGSKVRDITYWVSLLRYIGCTGHAHEVSVVFGDEISFRARTLVLDMANTQETVSDAIGYATQGLSEAAKEAAAQSLLDGLIPWAINNFTGGCEVGDMLTERLAVPKGVRTNLRFTFERWNGSGFPSGASGTSIPLPMRVVHLAHDMEAIARRESIDDALRAARDRRDRTYDPELTDLFALHGRRLLEELQSADPWDTVLEHEARPHRVLVGDQIDRALEVVADFVDVKSVYMGGHSRRCAELATKAAKELGLDDDTVRDVRRAALVHELGITALPNSILDKTTELTRSEWDRVRMHPLISEQMLNRTHALSQLAHIAGAHHERADGSGYSKGLHANAQLTTARLLCATEVFVGLTSDRADRPAHSSNQAAVELRRLAAAGEVDHDSVEAVLAVSGHRSTRRKPHRKSHPGGLSDREVEVLRLAARGLTTAMIAEILFISAKTADHHIQHIYTKIGVSTRAAASLWATQNELLS